MGFFSLSPIPLLSPPDNGYSALIPVSQQVEYGTGCQRNLGDSLRFAS